MFKKFSVYLQYFLPQHLLSFVMGCFANSRIPWLKNGLIRFFMKLYPVNLQEALEQNPQAFPTFNDFFIRHLNFQFRPMAQGAQSIVSPVDGVVSQIGEIHRQQLVQAKGLYFDLETLLGGNRTDSAGFEEGRYAVFYLAPAFYHRVHMPFAGRLVKSIFIPGKLFSVNRMTSRLIPCLYGRNERLVLIFETEVGRMAVILVGALIVGSIQTAWESEPVREKQLTVSTNQAGRTLAKGEEVGHFKMGSTVILLFEKEKIDWLQSLQPDMAVQVREKIGEIATC